MKEEIKTGKRLIQEREAELSRKGTPLLDDIKDAELTIRQQFNPSHTDEVYVTAYDFNLRGRVMAGRLARALRARGYLTVVDFHTDDVGCSAGWDVTVYFNRGKYLKVKLSTWTETFLYTTFIIMLIGFLFATCGGFILISKILQS